MNNSVNKLQVELHVKDFEPIKQYYTALGFEINWEREPEGSKGYLVMSLNGNTLCFWAGNQEVFNQPHFKQFPKDTPRGYGVEIVVVVNDIEDFYDKVKEIANVVEPLIEQPWGLRDFRTVDPEGYYLRFTSEHNILDPSNAVV
jgi:uncharacterized glyoxalase superfamily protein PhnB